MISEYVLLCSPYRYSSVFSGAVNKQCVEKELLSIVMAGVNITTRHMLKTMLETNYDITSCSSLKQEIANLENGHYHTLDDVSLYIDEIDNPNARNCYLSLKELAGSRIIQGFDDCRIIDVLTKSFAARLITKEEFEEIFAVQTERIKNSYQTWEQYLASCVLGKLFQGVPDSKTITSVEEYIVDIYSFCIAPTNVFSYGTFWAGHELERLTALLEELLQEESVKEIKARQNLVHYNDKIPGLNAPSNALIASFDANYMDTNLIDADRYQYVSELAEYAFFAPLVSNNLEWMITEKSLKEQDTVLLPAEFESFYSAREFWDCYKKYPDLHKEYIFAMFKGIFSINVVLTQEAAYTFKKKLFGKSTLVRIPWEEVDLHATLDLEFNESKILFDKKVISEVTPVINEIGLNENTLSGLNSEERKAVEAEWTQKMNSFLSDIPKRIREFKINSSK